MENSKPFINILNNKNSLQEDRIQALFSLMNIADKISLNAIFKCLKNDSCEIVRHEAAFVLGETADIRAIEELKKAVLEDKSIIVKHEALLAMGTLGDKSALSFIENQVNSKIGLVSESANIALQRLNLEKPYRGPDYFNYLKKKNK